MLVHCYAGQSRSAALVIAHLLAAAPGLGLAEAWAAVRAARPCARPNPGFLRQLAAYAQSLAGGVAAAEPATPTAPAAALAAPAKLCCGPADSAADEARLVLTQ